MFSRPTRFGVSSDDGLQIPGHLHFHPLGATAREVAAVELFADDALNAVPGGQLEKFTPLPEDVIGEPHWRPCVQNPPQETLALGQRHAPQVVPVTVRSLTWYTILRISI